MPRSSSLLCRALLAFLMLPAMIAFVLPWWIRPRGVAFRSDVLPVLAVGIIPLLWCVRDFYVAVLTIPCGWAIAFASPTIWMYTAIVAVAFHQRVVLFEEPVLARMHGPAFPAYRTRVPRWVGWVR